MSPKIDSKWMKDLKMRQESIKIIEENTGSNLFDLGHSNFFLDTLPKARATKAKINYWDFIKIYLFKASVQQRKQSTKPEDNGQNGKASTTRNQYH